MKNTKLLIPIVVIALFVVSLYSQITTIVSDTTKYNEYLSKARADAKLGLITALGNYQEALALKESVELYAEVADFFSAQGMTSDLEDWCEEMVELYPEEAIPYIKIINAYKNEEEYEECFDYIYLAEGREVESEEIKKLKDELYYVYDFGSSNYEDAIVYSTYYSPVKKKDYWGLVTRFGDLNIECSYVEVGAFTSSGYCPVVDEDGDAYFINEEDGKALATDTEYTRFGNIVDGIFPAEKPSGKYIYLNEEFEQVFEGEYDYASAFNNGIAAVKIGEKWKIIDEAGIVIKDNLDDVILDEKEMCAGNERAFVKVGNSYTMIDIEGNTIGINSYDDAILFADTTYTAVLKKGMWSFIDKEGNKVLETEYANARSFSNGLAAVYVNGAWGFIDTNGNLVIDATFEDARDFTAVGSCFVKNGGVWQLLKLYSLNRKD